MVCATISPAYPKDPVFTSKPICVRHVVITLSFRTFYILPYVLVTFVAINVTMSSDVTDI